MEIDKFNNKMSKYKESNYIVFSSCFFLYPIYIGFSCQLYIYSIPLFVSWAASVNYWRYPRYSIRRNTDIVFSTISCALFIYSFIFVLKNPYYYTNVIVAYYLFCLSSKKFEQDCPHWWKYHIAFHCLSSWNTHIVMNNVCLLKNGEHV